MSTLIVEPKAPTTTFHTGHNGQGEKVISTLTVESDDPAARILDDLAWQEEALRNDPIPVSLPPLAPAPAAVDTPYEVANHYRVLARLLDMANAYSASGSPRQATEMYFELVREHPETPQSRIAEERLLDMARAYEMAGEMRQARGIYEQLL